MRVKITYMVETDEKGGHDNGWMSEPGRKLYDASTLDLAPTIADVMGVPKAPEWEGKSLVQA